MELTSGGTWRAAAKPGAYSGAWVIPPLQVVLVNPEIPPNTGNVARLCAATRSSLHLVHPLGFRTDDRSLRRAGLDYWPHVEIHHHASLEAALDATSGPPAFYFTARGATPYTEAPYCAGARIIFGSETRGLPSSVLQANPESCFRIPIWGKVRSLNLSTAVGVVVYEGYRQLALRGGGTDPNELLHRPGPGGSANPVTETA